MAEKKDHYEKHPPKYEDGHTGPVPKLGHGFVPDKPKEK